MPWRASDRLFLVGVRYGPPPYSVDVVFVQRPCKLFSLGPSVFESVFRLRGLWSTAPVVNP
ncbi:MAG: hypothetical protein AAFQ81_01295 [Pseudomonadota bacterium]